MNSLDYKLYLQLIRPIQKKPLEYVVNVLALVGAYYTACEIEYGLFRTETFFDFFRGHVLIIIISALVLSLIIRRDKTECNAHIGGKDTSISLKLANILAVKNAAIVIPTNTTFDTIMDGEFISPQSIQGQFQDKYFHSDFSKLDQQLGSSLNKVYPTSFQLIAERTKSKQKQYPIGTVAEVVVNSRRFYFLAVADVNEKGKPINVTMNSMTEALVGLWTYLAREGHTENVAIPVIGTGRAGLKDGTFENVVHETIFSFSIYAREEFIAKKLILCIYPSTLYDANTSWDRLCDYMRLQCEYADEVYQKQKNSKPIGQAVE